MIDFHTHLLPKIDDGAPSSDCSVKMMEQLRSQGVSVVVATPHFYAAQENVESFLRRRRESYRVLRKKIEEAEGDYPEVILGAEVALTPEISKDENLERLCIGDSNAILIELPYDNYLEWMTYSIYEMISRRKLRPILAHFERFCTDKKMLGQYENLLSLDVGVQINADSFLDRCSYKMVKYFAKNNLIDVIGSDAHNMDTRKSNLDLAVRKIKRKFGENYLENLNQSSKKILGLI